MREIASLTLIGKALSHPLRERMLWLLADGERCGCEFGPELGYLGVMERAGLVTSRREGVRVMWSLSDPQLLDVLERLAELAKVEVV